MTELALVLQTPAEATRGVPANIPLEQRFLAVSRGLFRYVAVRVGGDVHLADDLVQQLWLEASRIGDAAEIHDLESWLRGVARNLIRQHWRRNGRRPALLPVARPDVASQVAALLDRELLPEEWLQKREVREQILLALTLLPAADQELIVRHHFHGEGQSRLAEANGCSVRAIEGKLYRARQALRDYLRELDPKEAS